MKKGFPHRFLCIDIGWKDRGYVNSIGQIDKASNVYFDKYDSCSRCKSKAHVGIEGKERFLFCPVCLQKLK